MKKMLRRSMLSRGFTLIELMLVLVILAVLATIVMRNFAGYSEKARVGAAKSQVKNIEGALEQFEIEITRYPTTKEGLNSLVENPGNIKGWTHSYMKQKVGNDPWGNPYVYKFPGTKNPNGYDVFSMGPDGTEGTDDDIGNWKEETK